MRAERGRRVVWELTTSGQPAEVDIVILYLVRVDKEEDLLCLLKVPCCCLCLSVIKIEDIIVEEVTLGGRREGGIVCIVSEVTMLCCCGACSTWKSWYHIKVSLAPV